MPWQLEGLLTCCRAARAVPVAQHAWLDSSLSYLKHASNIHLVVEAKVILSGFRLLPLLWRRELSEDSTYSRSKPRAATSSTRSWSTTEAVATVSACMTAR